MKLPPLGLYVHIPWCVKKCPYCDFNSHAVKGGIPEESYVSALLEDMEQELPAVQDRKIETLFLGGGTPSLFSAESLARLIKGLSELTPFSSTVEITIEVNPGTYEHGKFGEYHEIGINRLSLGVQSFQDDKLKRLGRIHSADEAVAAIDSLRSAGFDNFNIDLMHGLPQQSAADALFDLQQAIKLAPAHISWYQLTIEPNTVFCSAPPTLPADDQLWAIQKQGESLLADSGYSQYEVSAYCQSGRASRHNLNYWEFGDYIGIGAGAHGKVTEKNSGNIYRNWKTRMPASYLNHSKPFEAGRRLLGRSELPIEFMMNALRLKSGVSRAHFVERTGLKLSDIDERCRQAEKSGLLEQGRIKSTEKGYLFLNDLLTHFM